jgi:Tol biopolymer transport system component
MLARAGRAGLAAPLATESALDFPTPSPVPPPGQTRLTDPGCCSRPFWSPDSTRVGFLDKPSSDRPAGVYTVSAHGGGESLVFRQPGLLSNDWSLAAYLQDGETMVMRIADGEHWAIHNEGRGIRFSPSGSSVAWIVASKGASFPDRRQQTIWVARPDGTLAHRVLTITGGGLIGWDDDEQALLLTGRVTATGKTGIWRVDLESGTRTLLHASDGILDPLLSSDGRWLAFTVALQSDQGQNGLWVMRTDGSVTVKVTPFGAYRWRTKNHLLLIPLDLADPGAALWEVDAEAGSARQLTRPEDVPLPIANNDWAASPDGKSIVYVSSIDRAIWKVDLPTDSP